jgi:hypothetical protein
LTGYAIVAIIFFSSSLQTFGNNIISGIIVIVALSEVVLVTIVSFVIMTWLLTTNFCKKKN